MIFHKDVINDLLTVFLVILVHAERCACYTCCPETTLRTLLFYNVNTVAAPTPRNVLYILKKDIAILEAAETCVCDVSFQKHISEMQRLHFLFTNQQDAVVIQHPAVGT